MYVFYSYIYTTAKKCHMHAHMRVAMMHIQYVQICDNFA